MKMQFQIGLPAMTKDRRQFDVLRMSNEFMGLLWRGWFGLVFI